jgi:hypothetical protein
MNRMPELDLAPGSRAWTTGGMPVRRVGANHLNGSPDVTLSRELLAHADVEQLLADALASGAAWLDMAGERVSPATVVIEHANPEPPARSQR